MILIFSAPSGAGKSTLVNYLLQNRDDLEFSVSATTRAPRGTEQHGREYYFLEPDRFRQLIDDDAFVEYQQVYRDCYYGTLKSELDRINRNGHHVVFDVDVKGGANLKRIFGDDALALFIAPPSVETLRERLLSRNTDSPEKIDERVAKAAIEMQDAPLFDHVIVNDQLDQAKSETLNLVNNFLDK